MKNWIIVVLALLFGIAVAQEKERKTHTVTIVEEFNMSRDCDDVKGASPRNSWSIEVQGEHVTATCRYLDWDEEKSDATPQ